MRLNELEINNTFNSTGITNITGITNNINSGSTNFEIATAKSIFNLTSGSSSGVGLWEEGTGVDSLTPVSQNNDASGEGAVSYGDNTTASGDYSHAEGLNTTASGSYSHAEGLNTTASGSYSHAEGSNTTASGSYSHAEGSYTICSTKNSHAEGNFTNASGNETHAGGRGNSTYNLVANGKGSFNYSHQASTSTQYGTYGEYSAILGGTDNKTDSDGENSVILGGNNNEIKYINSTILGGNNNLTNSYAENSVIIGGNNNEINAKNSVILGGSNLTLNKDNSVLVQNLLVNDASNNEIHINNILNSKFEVITDGNTQTIADSTVTIVNFNTINFDILNEFSSGNSNFTAQNDGYYVFNVAIHFQLDDWDGSTNGWISFYKNGNYEKIIDRFFNTYNSTYHGSCGMYGTALIKLESGDILDLRVWQNSGRSKDISGNSANVYISGYRIS